MRDYFFILMAAALSALNSMFEVNPILNKLKEIRERTDTLRGYL